MSNIVPFSSTGELPAAITNRKRTLDVNKDIVTTAPFPTLSIEGKMFAISQDSERKVLTKPDDPEEILQSVNVAVLRINMHSKAYYLKAYKPGGDEGQRPDCYSLDGKEPSPNSPHIQAARCAVCPHNAYGSRVSEDFESKGKACSDKPRMAVADPNNLDKPMLLRVPPASIKPLKEALKMVKQRSIQYNETVFRIGFDKEAASPKLTFKPVGILDDASYEKAAGMFDSDIIRAITGMDDFESPPAPPLEKPEDDSADELDAALKERAAAKAEPKLEPKKAAKPEPKKAAKAEAKEAESTDAMLGELDDLLGGLDN